MQLFASALNDPDTVRVVVILLGLVALVSIVSLMAGRFLSLSSSEPTSILAQVTAEYENFPLFDGWTSTLSIGRSKFSTPAIILALHRFEGSGDERDTIVDRVCICSGCLESVGGDMVALYRDMAVSMVAKVKARQEQVDSFRRVLSQDMDMTPSLLN